MADTDNLIASQQALVIKVPLIGSTTPDTTPVLEVTGKGEVSVPTTLTEVRLGIEVQRESATEVQQEVARRSAAVVDVLRNLGAQELQTTSIQLNPVYNYENETQTLIGFKGSNTLQFELPTNQAGGAIDSAIQAGANVIQNINFTASDEALQQARLQVLSEAVKDAQAQAETVFTTLELNPGEIIDIDISSPTNPVALPLQFNAVRETAFANATTPVIGAPQTVNASVSLDIGYSPTSAVTLAGSTDSLIGVRDQALVMKDPLTGSTTPVLEVTGRGQISVPTTLTEVRLGIEVQRESATEVQQEVAQRSTAVVDVLRNLGAQELQTTSIELNPVYSNENETQTLIGFKGSNTLQFELPTNQAGAAVDSAIQAGANVIQNISFTASDEALQQARLQVLSEAVKDAQAQAETVFTTLQLNPGEIIDIDINSPINPRPSPFEFSLGADRALAFNATTPIIGGPLTIEASVSLDISYSPNSAGNLNPILNYPILIA
jgi:uncharacterized protein YggE